MGVAHLEEDGNEGPQASSVRSWTRAAATVATRKTPTLS